MINRREILAGLGASALTTASMPAWGRAGIDLNNRRDFLQSVVKMRGSTDERLCIGWVAGTRYAVVEHRAIPMMNLLAATFSQYRQKPGGDYEARSIEIAYFLDLVSGKLLETWRNPVTDRVVDVPQVRMGPSAFDISADGLQIRRAAGEAVGMSLNHRFESPYQRGDDVWITEVIDVNGKPRKDSRPFVYNEMSTYHARLSDLANPALATVPANISFHGLVTFRSWMGFADTPGHTTAHGSGTRASRMAELPAYHQELTKALHPDVYANPLEILSETEDS